LVKSPDDESSSVRDLSQREQEILDYLRDVKKATLKDIAAHVNVSKNRAAVENHLLRLFMKDEVMMARRGRTRIWMPNHIVVQSVRRPIAMTILPEVDESGRSIRKFWFDLFHSQTKGDYIYVQESRYLEGEGWVSKGGNVLPIDMVTDYVSNLLKVAIRSDEFRKNHPELYKEQENFLKQISPYVGVQASK